MYITIEGPIGIGKTSLTEMIASNHGFKTVHEIVEENPFLSKFYEKPEKWAFQTEMFFLTNRYVQLNHLNKVRLQNSEKIVSDYNIHKNLIFAKKNLCDEDYNKFKDVYSTLTQDIKSPDIVVFLHADLETLKHRISIRGRSFELDMDDSYLESLIDAYEEYKLDYCRMFPDNYIIIDCSKFDYVNDMNDRQEISDLVLKKINEVQNAQHR